MITEGIFQDRATLEKMAAQAAHYDGEKARVLGKHFIYVDERDKSVARWLISDGFWESWITVTMARIIQPGMYCLDIGAHMGYFTALMADGVGETGRVLAVEANPENAKMLKKSAMLNGWEWVEVRNLAIADKSGERVQLAVWDEMSGGATIMGDEELAGDWRGVEVETATVDELVKGWERVDFIKMDIEGAEMLAWKGMQKTLDAHPGIQIFMEFCPDRYPDAGAFLDSITGRFPLRCVNYNSNIMSVERERVLGEDWWTLYLGKAVVD